MGKKSAKGREKKMKRKEEQALLAIAQAKVDEANSLEDPMESLAPFKKYNRQGLNLTIDSQRRANVDERTLEWAFKLTQTNMKRFYEESKGGWKWYEKKDEMMDQRAWYLIARETDGSPVGLIHFRFDIDFDDEVVYCYEIQLQKSVRRKGLGKFLMQILALIAHKTNMKKVMLTVFKKNETAFNFFEKVLKFEIDETSPSIYDPMYEYDYEIMSKKIPQKASNAAGGAVSTDSSTSIKCHSPPTKVNIVQ